MALVRNMGAAPTAAPALLPVPADPFADVFTRAGSEAPGAKAAGPRKARAPEDVAAAVERIKEKRRQSAQRSRDRKSAYIGALEEENGALRAQVAALRAQLASLMSAGAGGAAGAKRSAAVAGFEVPVPVSPFAVAVVPACAPAAPVPAAADPFSLAAGGSVELINDAFADDALLYMLDAGGEEAVC